MYNSGRKKKRELLKEVRALKRVLKGDISVLNLTSYLSSLGYSTVFYNTEDGNDVLTAYGFSLDKVSKAFTYNGVTQVVFIDNNLHAQDKIYSLLHEIGHITLGHLDADLNQVNNREIENAAEAFAFMMLF